MKIKYLIIVTLLIGCMPGYSEDKDTLGLQFNITPKTTFKFGGALWINYANQAWISPDISSKRGLRFDNLRISFDGNHGDHLLFSAQYRFYSYTRAIHHAWIGIKPNEKNQIEIGVTQVPFGILPFSSQSWWASLAYYLGMEDDNDAGIKWHLKSDHIDFHLAYFYSEEYGDATNLNRYSTDLVRVGEQQNEETSQGNIRFAYVNGRGTDYKSEFGVSGEIGGINYSGMKKNGIRWKGAFHYSGYYNGWNPEIQVVRYEFHPENPDSVDNRLVLMGNLTSTRLVAAKGNVINANIRKFWDVNWWVFDQFNAYYNYYAVFKDESSFKQSQIHDAGCVLMSGPVWIWIDFIFGKNAWYLNESQENSGLGPGGTDKWERRFNINLEWYF